MLTKNFVLICDGCSRQEWFPDAKKKTVKIAQDQLGWIVKGNKHYCSKECFEIKEQK